jgi:hypothetical protein
MNSRTISVAVEGDSDEALARKLLGLFDFTAAVVYVQKGKDRLDSKLGAFNHAADYAPWFILRDLDQDAECASELIQNLMPQRASQMCFRIAVRAAEAWLLADRKRLSQFIGVPLSKLSVTPDRLENPKQELVNLARKSRKNRFVKIWFRPRIPAPPWVPHMFRESLNSSTRTGILATEPKRVRV